MRKLANWLAQNADEAHYLFSLQDLKAVCSDLTHSAFRTLLTRMVKTHQLKRVCRGLYLYQSAAPSNGLLLYHVAARLRANEFNYISLESVLSDSGVISQVPINWITIMSSGRSNTISCGAFGNIEFIHTHKSSESISNQLSYDERCQLWRASVKLALNDMKATHRNCDLINWDIANELI